MSPRTARLAPLFSPPMGFPAIGRVGTVVVDEFSFVVMFVLLPLNVFPAMPVLVLCTWAFSSVLTLIAGRPRPPP